MSFRLHNRDPFLIALRYFYLSLWIIKELFSLISKALLCMCPESHSFMLSLRPYCMRDLVGVGLLFCIFSFFLFNVSSSLVFKHRLVSHILKKTSPFTHSFSVNLIQSSAPLKKEVCFHLLIPHVFKLSHFCF